MSGSEIGIRAAFEEAFNGMTTAEIKAMAKQDDSIIEMKRDAWFKPKTWHIKASAKEDTDFLQDMDDFNNMGFGGSRFKDFELYDQPGAYVHKKEVIWRRAFNFANPTHRWCNFFFNPWYGVWILKLAQILSSITPKFIVPGTEEDPEPTINEEARDYWEEIGGNALLFKTIIKSFIGGMILYYPYEKPFPGYSGNPWSIYTYDEIDGHEPIGHDHGHPTVWQIRPSNKYIEEAFKLRLYDWIPTIKFKENGNLDISELPALEECGFFDWWNSDDFGGIPLGSQVWDIMIDLLFMEEAMTSYDQRMGSGYIVVIAPTGTRAQIEERIKNVRTEKGLVIEHDFDDGTQVPIQVEWQSAASQVDFPAHITKCEEGIVRTTGYPKRFWQGDPEGAMESSGKDKLQIHVKAKQDFMYFIPFIKLVLKMGGVIKEDKDIVIQPGFKMSLSEEEIETLKMMKVDRVMAMAGICTINECRKELGLKELADEEANQLFPQSQEEGGEGNDASADTDIRPSKVDSWEGVKDIFNDFSAKNGSKYVNVADKTFSKIRSAVNDIFKPVSKMDSYEIKEDAVEVEPGIWEVDDVPVVLPQEKSYRVRGSSKLCVRSPEEIQKLFDDPTTPREFRIGGQKDDSHPREYAQEVQKDKSYGIVKLKRLDENGRIRAKIRYVGTKIRKVLGNDNWVEDYLKQGKNPPTSLALRSVDIPLDNGSMYETKLDLRSFVNTRKPRNSFAGQ